MSERAGCGLTGDRVTWPGASWGELGRVQVGPAGESFRFAVHKSDTSVEGGMSNSRHSREPYGSE